ncbi:hypothetical protein AVEN_97846-1 [Araneus ventricosus]|uniref:Uncharacterized protein n=1 Tax=Araneus ventricosus TaxID=182803 RepID=A0A4Y2RN08_ARAVE|nr:hypothetical protein AVEN_97846-1 [Araneus ventricosus]
MRYHLFTKTHVDPLHRPGGVRQSIYLLTTHVDPYPRLERCDEVSFIYLQPIVDPIHHWYGGRGGTIYFTYNSTSTHSTHWYGAVWRSPRCT